MWVLPEGARYVNEKTYNLLRGGNFTSGSYYRLVLLSTHLFAVVGMAGEVRFCPQDWAQQQFQLSRKNEFLPLVEAIYEEEYAGSGEMNLPEANVVAIPDAQIIDIPDAELVDYPEVTAIEPSDPAA